MTNNALHCCMNWSFTCLKMTWWRHQMETFSALLALCAGKSPVTKASDAELWCFLWYAPEFITLEQTIVRLVIWQGCHRLGRKKFPDFSLTFPWLPEQIPVTVATNIQWVFFHEIYHNHCSSQLVDVSQTLHYIFRTTSKSCYSLINVTLQHCVVENNLVQEDIFNIKKTIDILHKYA